MNKSVSKTETRNERISISVTKKEKQLLQRLAKKENESMTEILMRALKNYSVVKLQPEMFKE